MNWMLNIATLALVTLNSTLHSFSATISQQHTGPEDVTFTIQCRLDENEMLFHNSIQFSFNSPDVRIKEWSSPKSPCTYFDSITKKSLQAYSDHVTFVIVTRVPDQFSFAGIKLHMNYQTTASKMPAERIFLLGESGDVVRVETNAPAATQSTPSAPPTAQSLKQRFQALTQSLLSWIQNKELSIWVKFLLAFIIGVFMSLTPCIYPMIPITIGILQGNKSTSVGRSFALALVYTCGISCTFAILGFLAAFAGAQFGSLMSNPLVIIPIVIIFGYLGFSMLGFYDMYTPKFMRARTTSTQKGSFVSAFVFGLINGTVASPCLSPGLALILGIVAQMANKFLGFLLLFVFGIGSSLPLLIIGTFSSALHFLPRAGMWMIEFKKVFGFLLLGMCIYYLGIFMSADVFYITLGIYLVLIGIYYFVYGLKARSHLTKIVGILLFAGAAFSFVESSKAALEPAKTPFAWETNYAAMREKARQENKLMLLDFMTSWCSACKIVDKNFFGLPVIQKEVPLRVVPVKVDCSDMKDETASGLAKKFGVTGYPTFVLVDPNSETVIRTWYADITEKTPATFLKELVQ